MRDNNLLAPTRMASVRGPRTHDGTILPEAVNTMWGTDLTATFTGEGQAAVFIAVDHCPAECVGVHAHARATRFEAWSRSGRVCGVISAGSRPPSHGA
jgi:putative transposase